jgi:hypothetical protein
MDVIKYCSTIRFHHPEHAGLLPSKEGLMRKLNESGHLAMIAHR